MKTEKWFITSESKLVKLKGSLKKINKSNKVLRLNESRLLTWREKSQKLPVKKDNKNEL